MAWEERVLQEETTITTATTTTAKSAAGVHTLQQCPRVESPSPACRVVELRLLAVQRASSTVDSRCCLISIGTAWCSFRYPLHCLALRAAGLTARPAA